MKSKGCALIRTITLYLMSVRFYILLTIFCNSEKNVSTKINFAMCNITRGEKNTQVYMFKWFDYALHCHNSKH